MYLCTCVHLPPYWFHFPVPLCPLWDGSYYLGSPLAFLDWTVQFVCITCLTTGSPTHTPHILFTWPSIVLPWFFLVLLTLALPFLYFCDTPQRICLPLPYSAPPPCPLYSPFTCVCLPCTTCGFLPLPPAPEFLLPTPSVHACLLCMCACPGNLLYITPRTSCLCSLPPALCVCVPPACTQRYLPCGQGCLLCTFCAAWQCLTMCALYSHAQASNYPPL